MKESKEILYHYTSDMLGVEKHLLEVLNWQASANRLKGYREAHDLIRRIQDTLHDHTRLLERYIEALEVKTSESAVKKAVTRISGMATGLYNLMRQEDSVARNLRDDYTALNMAAVSYTMLHTTALAHHDTELAAMTLKHLKELTPFIVELSRLIPGVLVQELSAQDKAPDPDVVQKALENTQEAWRMESAP